MPVIFLHIPRTGGSTLRTQVLKYHFPLRSIYKIKMGYPSAERFKKMSQQEKDKIKLLAGHMPFGLHQYFSFPCTYITFLRNPVEGVISWYYWLRRKPNLNRKMIRGDSLEKYLERNINATNNLQTRMLSANPCLIEDGVAFLPPDALETAKRNLEKIKVVGVTEKFDETLLLIQKEFGWKRTYYGIVNTTVGERPDVSEIPTGIIETVKRNNQLDIELYEFAKDLLAKRIKACGPSFEKDLKRFKRINILYQKTVYPVRKTLKTWEKKIKLAGFNFLKK